MLISQPMGERLGGTRLWGNQFGAIPYGQDSQFAEIEASSDS
jgi:hypothetical protein